ncbi:LAGLIDADG endonuclease [Pyrenophora seminiperda CCB06]|uniref:LAGLIDADG endonuclease (Mitochondrion) n=1 Tax=Pyrenophora seminiperda CCB06 TaxID=1302712 RepID=A0A3M7M5L9_9PLEO|nr:LAGLIDADG endonuclease [Pyrenophora seminiperda CCB06]
MKVQLMFTITQHTRDEALINSLVNYLKGGLITKSRNSTVFYVSNLKDVNQIIIPFFEKYPFKGAKLLDYLDWCEAARMLQNKEHLTESGLKNLLLLKEKVLTRKQN